MKSGLTIHMYYAEGPAYWLLGHLEEFASFERADRQLDEWGHISRGEGVASFAIYIDDELVYDGAYDLAIVPADLKRQVNLFLESLDTQDAVILLGALAEQNPKLEKGYVDPDTGAWRSRRRFETGADVSEMSASIVEDPNTVDDINAALLGGTLGIGSHGLVTVASHERIDTGEGPPEAARTWHHAAERRRQEERRAREAGEVAVYRFTPERIAEISAGHGLDLGGYEYENVRDEWARIFADAGIAGVLEIDADTFGGEVMGSSRDFFGINIHSLNSPVVLFEPGANDPDDRWPETLPAPGELVIGRRPDTYVLVNNGVLNEYEHDCICSEEPVDTERENCPRCEGTGYTTHTGGNWALYEWVEGALFEWVEGEEIDEDDEDEYAEEWLTERYGPHQGLNADWIGMAWPIGHNLWVVDDESEDSEGRPLYSIIKRIEADDEYEDTVMWDPSPFVNIIEIIRQRDQHGFVENVEGVVAAIGTRRISSDIYGAETYIVEGYRDENGDMQYVADAVRYLRSHHARATNPRFPTDLSQLVEYVRPGQPNVTYRLHGPWRIEERAAIYKFRAPNENFINQFKPRRTGEHHGTRVQLFYGGHPGTGIRDIVIITWFAGEYVGNNIIGFSLVNGDTGIEILSNQISVTPERARDKTATVRDIMDLLGVRVVFGSNNWPEEYYLNAGMTGFPFVEF